MDGELGALGPGSGGGQVPGAEQGLFVVGLDAGGDTPVEDLAVADAPLAIVVGSEGRGLSRLVAERCDVLARIPMAADTESLNAGVAAGIALHAVAAARAARRPS